MEVTVMVGAMFPPLITLPSFFSNRKDPEHDFTIV